MPDIKPRIRARIPHELWVLLKAASSRKNSSQSKILTAALSSHFSYEVDDERDALILERLDLMTRNHHRLSRDVNLLTETVSLFLQYYFTMAPRIPQSEKDARASQGLVDFNQFIDRLGENMKRGGRTFKRALEDVLISDEDFFRLEELELIKALSDKKTVTVQSPKKKKSGDGDE